PTGRAPPRADRGSARSPGCRRSAPPPVRGFLQPARTLAGCALYESLFSLDAILRTGQVMTSPQPPENAPGNPLLALYHTTTCWYCAHVRQVIADLGIDVPLRDVARSPEYRQELIAGGGKGQVPCLRLEHADGRVEWMYESADIARYLMARFASAIAAG